MFQNGRNTEILAAEQYILAEPRRGMEVAR
jgi:hypothetical protein